MFVQPFYFVSYYVSYYVYCIEYDDYFFIFIFRRRIIIGWGRDTGTILWPIRNSIRICGWRLARQVDPIKIGFTGSPTLRPTTCGRPVVFQPLGAPNLRSSWLCSNSPRNTIPKSGVRTTQSVSCTTNSGTKSRVWATQSVSSTTKSGVWSGSWTAKSGLWTASRNDYEIVK